MNNSLPDTLKAFVDEKSGQCRYGADSKDVSDVMREDQDHQSLREMLLKGAGSIPAAPADKAYFHRLRERVRLD